MTMPVPPADDQPTYIDPVTGQPLYVDPTTGQLAYTDPTAAAPADPAAIGGYPPPAYTPYPGYPGPSQPEAPTSGYTTPTYPQGGYAAPAYGAPGYGAPAYGYPGYGAIAVQPRTNPLSITSMVLSLVGVAFLVCYGFGGLLGLAGAITGHIARKQTRERGEQGDGMALTGIIVGWIVLALGVLIVIGIIWFVVWASNHTSDFGDPSPYPYPS